MTVKKKFIKLPDKIGSDGTGLEDEPKKEVRKVPVTQIVEIVEDDAPPVSDSVEPASEPVQSVRHADVTKSETVEEAEEHVPLEAETPPEISEEPSEESTSASDEKRKELVDELFQKRIDTPVSAVAPEITMHTPEKGKPVYMWAVGVVTACLVVGVSLLMFSGKGGQLPSIISVPTPTPSPSPKATPTPTPVAVDRKAVTVQVLNGGGTPGAATKMKTYLEEKGYVVKNTGNTEEYTYDKTEIHVKTEKKDYIATLENDLKSSYSLGTSAATLEDSVSYDIRIIVGKE